MRLIRIIWLWLLLAGAPLGGWCGGIIKAAPAGEQVAESASAKEQEPELSAAQIDGMVARLAAKLRENPDDADGWKLLGRSYSVMGRFQEAVDAYAKAVQRAPRDAQLLADFADALAMSRGQRLEGGICVNDWLRREGLLVLRSDPPAPGTPLAKCERACLNCASSMGMTADLTYWALGCQLSALGRADSRQPRAAANLSPSPAY